MEKTPLACHSNNCCRQDSWMKAKMNGWNIKEQQNICSKKFSPKYSLTTVVNLVHVYKFLVLQFSCSVMSDSLQPMDCSTGLPVHHQLPEFTQTHVHWLGDAIQPSHPLSSPSPPAFNLSSTRVFSNESVLHIRWPKYWSFSFNISPSNEHPRLISFRMDWLALLFSFLYSSTLTSIHNYWKNHSLD